MGYGRTAFLGGGDGARAEELDGDLLLALQPHADLREAEEEEGGIAVSTANVSVFSRPHRRRGNPIMSPVGKNIDYVFVFGMISSNC